MEYVTPVTLVFFMTVATTVAHRRFGLFGLALAFCPIVCVLSLGGIVFPFLPLSLNFVAIFVTAFAAVIAFLAFVTPVHAIAAVRQRTRGHRAAATVFLNALTVLGVFGLAELATRCLTLTGVLHTFAAVQTVLQGGHEDWREYHMTADSYREPDPVLFWRPVARPPYSSQRFKSAKASLPKPATTYRIMTYGDSNTDGPLTGAWPARLQEALARRNNASVQYEVLNAGVTGYSSYQGLKRFEQEVSTFEPDLVFASFGWNDLPEALGKPDNQFIPPPKPIVAILRLLTQYQCFLALKYYLPAATTQTQTPSGLARVPLNAYVDNLTAFARNAIEHRSAVVLLTRPHQLPTADMIRQQSWRRHVPEYNNAVRQLGRTRNIPVIDVQAHFEAAGPSYFVDECHFTEAGHRRMADFLAARLKELGVLREHT